MQTVSLSSMLIVGAVGSYVIGFLFRDQVLIRLLVVLGSVFYGAYYWIVAQEPLWDAILGAALIGLASLQGAIQILWSRTDYSSPPETRRLLEQLGDMEPGLFRRLLRSGEQLDVSDTLVLTVEHQRPDSLWLLMDGEVLLGRSGRVPAVIKSPCFVAEIAWLTGDVASGTVTAKAGARLLRLRHNTLRRILRRNQRLERALEALLAQDLARKLSRSDPIVADVASGS
ncbi:MAG: cyclic nucleotide-binding domain-containing protein [Pseudomonadota bacterium]